ncbi:thiol reductant ABC exporter subunit CydD, partial [Microbacterium azadirachtae]|uniref:thiol reductant ABC exporter subunit CydD n=1 Tax=Microbacterium azadirachtae TaxID=582680 RepID=UPI000B124446
MKPIDPRLLRWAPAARTYLAVSAGIALVQTAVVIAFAGLLATGITAVAEGRSPAGALPWLALVVVVRAVLLWVSEAWGARAAAQTGRELRDALLDAIARRGPAWLGERNRSALAVIAGHGLDALDPYFARYIPQLVLTAIATPVIVVVMWWQDWPSGLAAVVTLPLIPLFLILIGIATRGVQRRQLTVLQTLAARFADTVQGLATLRLFGRERRAAARMRETAEQYRRETLRVLRYSFLSGFALELLSSLAVAIIAVSVGLRLLDGELTLGVGLFVLLLAPEAFLPLRQVGVQFHAAAEGVAATEDVFEILDASAAPPTGAHRAMSVATPPSGQPTSLLDTGSGIRLVVDGVAVRHRERRLPEVSFTAEPGTVTLVEGRSGSGKSSLLAALRGAVAYDGSIRVDGAATADPSSWLAWAGQRPGLIRGTIAANVALGDSAPDAARVRAALDDAAAADLDPAQELGVQGAGLSGGQAQRVGVARALYRLWSGARVLVLDEPSSALDAATEDRLWRAIRRAADGGATVLLVSHRHSARAIADRVVRIGEAESAADTTLRSAPGAGSTASGPSERQPSRPEPIADPEPGPEPDPIPDLPASVGGILRLAMPR